MSSVRLPGKVLLDLGGRPLLSILLARVVRARNLSAIVVATSDQADDDSIAALCSKEGVECFRGALGDVASRFVAIARRDLGRCIVRISGDSPFSDPELIDDVIQHFWDGACDLVTTSSPRTTPHGMSVEAISAQSLVDAYPHFASPEDHEHVTRYFYSHRDTYQIRSYAPQPPYLLDGRVVVDTPEDLVRARAIVHHLGATAIEARGRDILKIAERL